MNDATLTDAMVCLPKGVVEQAITLLITLDVENTWPSVGSAVLPEPLLKRVRELIAEFQSALDAATAARGVKEDAE